MSSLTADLSCADEIRFFKREGYLIKRGVLDPELMARARERKWAGAPARMQRDDPGTWFGPFRADEELVEERDNYRHDFTWKYMAPAREPWIVAMLATNPVILGWSQQLLGRNEVEAPERIRGIYCQLPEGDLPPRPTVCHCDVTPDRLHSTPLAELLAPGLGAVGLIADIPPAGGAFTVGGAGTARRERPRARQKGSSGRAPTALSMTCCCTPRGWPATRRISGASSSSTPTRAWKDTARPATSCSGTACWRTPRDGTARRGSSSAKPCCATTASGRTRFPIPSAPSRRCGEDGRTRCVRSKVTTAGGNPLHTIQLVGQVITMRLSNDDLIRRVFPPRTA